MYTIFYHCKQKWKSSMATSVLVFFIFCSSVAAGKQIIHAMRFSILGFIYEKLSSLIFIGPNFPPAEVCAPPSNVSQTPTVMTKNKPPRCMYHFAPNFKITFLLVFFFFNFCLSIKTKTASSRQLNLSIKLKIMKWWLELAGIGWSGLEWAGMGWNKK